MFESFFGTICVFELVNATFKHWNAAYLIQFWNGVLGCLAY